VLCIECECTTRSQLCSRSTPLCHSADRWNEWLPLRHAARKTCTPWSTPNRQARWSEAHSGGVASSRPSHGIAHIVKNSRLSHPPTAAPLFTHTRCSAVRSRRSLAQQKGIQGCPRIAHVGRQLAVSSVTLYRQTSSVSPLYPQYRVSSTTFPR
jgi:hypothetical protein